MATPLFPCSAAYIRPACGYVRLCFGKMFQTNPLRGGLTEDRTSDPCAVVIFGASGDLTRRKLMPALYNLASAHSLSGGFAVVGVARREKTDESFRAEMKQAVAAVSRRTPLDRAV